MDPKLKPRLSNLAPCLKDLISVRFTTIGCSWTHDLRAVWNFTRATLAHDAAADEYREAIVKRWGRRALVSLAFAITAARIYPTVKYALGHGEACRRVVVGGTPVMFDHGRVPADIAVRTP